MPLIVNGIPQSYSPLQGVFNDGDQIDFPSVGCYRFFVNCINAANPNFPCDSGLGVFLIIQVENCQAPCVSSATVVLNGCIATAQVSNCPSPVLQWQINFGGGYQNITGANNLIYDTSLNQGLPHRVCVSNCPNCQIIYSNEVIPSCPVPCNLQLTNFVKNNSGGFDIGWSNNNGLVDIQLAISTIVGCTNCSGQNQGNCGGWQTTGSLNSVGGNSTSIGPQTLGTCNRIIISDPSSGSCIVEGYLFCENLCANSDLSGEINDLKCNGASSQGLGGAPVYSYSWVAPNGIIIASQNLTRVQIRNNNLPNNNTWTLIITDSNGCVVTLSEELKSCYDSLFCEVLSNAYAPSPIQGYNVQFAYGCFCGQDLTGLRYQIKNNGNTYPSSGNGFNLSPTNIQGDCTRRQFVALAPCFFLSLFEILSIIHSGIDGLLIIGLGSMEEID